MTDTTPRELDLSKYVIRDDKGNELWPDDYVLKPALEAAIKRAEKAHREAIAAGNDLAELLVKARHVRDTGYVGIPIIGSIGDDGFTPSATGLKMAEAGELPWVSEAEKARGRAELPHAADGDWLK